MFRCLFCVCLASCTAATQCAGDEAGDFDDGALLQSKRSVQQCPLPQGGAWANVNLPGLQPFRMAVYAKNDIVSDALLSQHEFEGYRPELYGTPAHAYDIGGNIGFYSFALAKSGWNVTTFEPMTANAALFQASLCANPDVAAQIDLHVSGLSDADSHCVMMSDRANVGDGHVICDGKTSDLSLEVRGEFDLRVLDHEMSTTKFVGQPVKFVKIDVEGFECHVWRGASELLKQRPRLIQSEVWGNMRDCTPAEYLQLFKDANYEVKADVHCQQDAPENGPTRNGEIVNYWMCADRQPEGVPSSGPFPKMAAVSTIQTHLVLRGSLGSLPRGPRRTVLMRLREE